MKQDLSGQIKLSAKIMKRVFGDQVSLDPLEFQQRYLSSVRLPKEVVSQLTNQPAWTSSEALDSFIDQAAVTSEAGRHDWLYPTQDITSEAQLQKLIKRFDFMQASRTYDSHDVFGSDDVARSHDVFNSINVVDSSNIVSCSWIWDSEYLFGCARSGASTYCIGLNEGVKCSDSYQVHGSHKIVKSMFIKSSYDLTECLFCAHLQHKQYCIANMQYDEKTYFELKEKILNWLFPQ